jgi:phosphonoacetate hydrolase
MSTFLELHGRRYRRPTRPTVVVCLDGSDPRYHAHEHAHDDQPTLTRWRRDGFATDADGEVPSFTNPNNLSIVTGASPAVHGISGNYFLDPESGAEVSMNVPAFVTATTLLRAFSERGVRVAAVTAKRKLLAMLDPGPGGVTIAIEAGGDALAARLGRPAPDVYSADASLAVLDVGLALLAAGESELLYLSTTDYIQHKYAPETPEARAFYRAVDARLAALEAAGADVVFTADHGMNAKTRADGAPNVLFLEPLLADVAPRARVTLPITDPYVLHHGSLGGAAMIYLFDEPEAAVRRALEGRPELATLMNRAEAAATLELPPARIGDLVALASPSAVLGKSPAHHDLAAVATGLRSHGGAVERRVPLVSSRPLPLHRSVPTRWRNRDAFWLALGVDA